MECVTDYTSILSEMDMSHKAVAVMDTFDTPTADIKTPLEGMETPYMLIKDAAMPYTLAAATDPPSTSVIDKDVPKTPVAGKENTDTPVSGTDTPETPIGCADTSERPVAGNDTLGTPDAGTGTPVTLVEGMVMPCTLVRDTNTPDTPVTGTNTPDTPVTRTNTPDTPVTRTNTPNTPVTDTNTPETPFTGMNTAGTPFTGTHTPNTPVTGTNTPDTSVTGKNTPDTPVTGTNTPDTPVTGTNTPDIPLTGTNTPNTPVTGTNTPETPFTDTNTPDTPVTGTNTPDTPVTRTNTPNTPVTGTNTPEKPFTGMNTAGTPFTVTNTPNTAVTGTNTPDTSVTGKNTPDTPVTGTNTPDTPVTGTNTPDTPVTGTNTPDTPVAGTDPPDIPISGMDTPDTPETQDRWVRAVEKAKKNEPIKRSPSQQLLKDLRDGQDLSQWSPELCVQMLRIPSSQNYSAIAKLLEQSNKEWLVEFLERDGLGMLLECLNLLGDLRTPSVADTLTQIQCVTCIKTVMEFEKGFYYMAEHPDYVQQLARSLSSRNPTLKLQIYELLCVVSYGSSHGHVLVLEALDNNKEYYGCRFRFEVIIREIQTAESDFLRSRALALVNCLITGGYGVRERERLRREFLGVGLGGVLSNINTDNELLHIQREAFYKIMEGDRVELQADPASLSPELLFQLVYSKIVDSPVVSSFITMLINLSQIDISKPATDQVWKLLEKVSAEGSVISENYRLDLMTIRSMCSKSTQTTVSSYPVRKYAKSCVDEATQVEVNDIEQMNSGAAHQQSAYDSSKVPPSASLLQSESISSVVPPPPPFPQATMPSVSQPPPPPPLPLLISGHAYMSSVSPPPPPPISNLSYPPPPPPPFLGGFDTLPKMREPLPIVNSNKFNTWHGSGKKMKTINWKKIPKAAIVNSIWSSVDMVPSLDSEVFTKMEELFCQSSQASSMKPKQIKKPSAPEVTFLDSKRSLSVNVFLKKVGGGNSLIQAVKDVSCNNLDPDVLQRLQKLLPQKQELESISANITKLEQFGAAEKFFHEISQIPSYSLRVEALNQRDVFATKMKDLKPQLHAVIDICDKVIENKSLGDFLGLVLQLGNALNFGSYAGSAVGFTLDTLPKLTETRSNKANMSFLHYVLEVVTHNKNALAFTEELSHVSKISRIPVETLDEEVKMLSKDVRSLSDRISKDKKNIPSTFRDFMVQALEEVKELQEISHAMNKAIARLAQHFCETPEKFKPESFFRILADFFTVIKKAQKENEERQRREKRATSMNIRRSKKTLPASEEIPNFLNEIAAGGFHLKHVEPSC